MKDKYYLKKGKLELSALDEEVEEGHSEKEESCKEEPTHKLNEKMEVSSESKLQELQLTEEPQYIPLGQEEIKETVELKISDEIHNTLKTMGELLTQSVGEVTDEEKALLLNGVEGLGSEKNLGKSLSFGQSKKIKGKELKETNASEAQLLKAKKKQKDEDLLGQEVIDDLIEEHLGKVQPKFKYAEELKNKIDERIKWIKSYSSKAK